MSGDEELLLQVLNTAPVVDGEPVEQLVGRDGVVLAKRLGGTGSDEELRALRGVRDALQHLIAGRDGATAALQSLLGGVRMTPLFEVDGIRWQLDAPPELAPAARVAQAWTLVNERRPGRLRPCANEQCNLFLIDRTRPGTAKWCSMSTCGNRMKARAYATRQRAAQPSR
ncbi:CGNR zinc finger domain-containing protein [Streptomyces shenzhenensis]|uniref:Zinc finger CGNR domain-containing protein n=1 Tax=Streptomyces shenzhenensis TaxID=943815 RepID=A0A3M0I872_9ACTN|nr:CGNR zinc finger domain-containing protein [Streptomyces shenzhenensis]RMB82399.1 hypothetical protein CTZ28_30210 [Streptomyces shenzhenensis]